MSTLTLDLSDTDRDRLAEVAKERGLTIEQVASAAVKAQLDADTAARREIEAGLAELDAGLGMNLEDFEHEMDGFLGDLQHGRG